MISKISNPDSECVPSNSEIPAICSSAMSAARDARSRVARALDLRVLTEQARIRILSVDDQPLIREGIAAIIDNRPDMALVSQCSSGTEAIRDYRKHRPDVTLMGSRLPDMSGIDTMIAIRAEFPQARIIVLTAFEGDAEIRRALAAGARAYLLKSIPTGDLAQVIRDVYAGRKRIPAQLAEQLAAHMTDAALTPREIEILEQLAGGNRNRDIGEHLFISEQTVKVHLKHLMDKLGAKDRTQAFAIAVRRGIIARY